MAKSNGSDLYVYVLMDGGIPGPFYYSRWKFMYQPFYVGKGYGRRYLHHESSAVAGDGCNPHKSRKIRKIHRLGNCVEVRLVKTGLSNRTASCLERRLIQVIGRSDLRAGPLTNLTDGGEGTPGIVVPRLRRLKISRSKTGKKMPADFVEKRKATMLIKSKTELDAIRAKKQKTLAKVWTKSKRKNHAAVVSGAKLGHSVSEETRAKISAALKGRPCSDERRQKLLGRIVPDDVRNKISLSLIGHQVSDETRKKISRTRTRGG